MFSRWIPRQNGMNLFKLASCSLLQVCFTLELAVWQPLCIDDPDCGWAAGDGMQIGVDLMVEHINREGYLVDGESLTFTLRDTACSATVGLKAAVDVVLSSERPFTVVGCGCSGCSGQAAQVFDAAQVPIISHSATGASLSSRENFPSFFRTISPDQGILQATARAYLSFKWMTFTAIFDTDGDEQHSSYWDSLVTSLGATDPLAGLAARVIEATSEATTIVKTLLATNLRGVAVITYEMYARAILCSMYNQLSGGEGFVVGTYGWFASGWLTSDLSDHSCTAAQMKSAFNYGITSLLTPWNDLTTGMPCSTTGTSTVADFRTELLARGDAAGIIYRPEASTAADAICMAAMAYNSMRNMGYAPEELSPLNETSFSTLMSVFQKTAFEGVSGSISFPEDGTALGGSDRIGTFAVQQTLDGEEEQLGEYDQASGVLTLLDGKTFHFPNGFAMDNLPAATFPTCDTGLVYDYTLSACTGCSNESIFISSAGACLCRAGYTDGGDSTADCEPCARGRYTAIPGQSECLACPAGQYQDTEGNSACLPCPRGSYSDSAGQDSCTACPTGMDTDGKGFSSADYCGCPEGTFLPSGGSSCLPCGQGSDCAGFGAEPESLEGYVLWEADRDGLSIFRCLHLQAACPGGPRRTCAEGREGTSCSECKSGMTPASEGTCRDCEASDQIPMVIIAILVAVLLVLAYFGICWFGGSGKKSSEGVITTITILGQFLASFQALQAISKINVDWENPLSEFLSIAEAVVLDVDLLRLSCLGVNTELFSYFSALLVIVIILAYTAGVHILHRLASFVQGNVLDGMPLIVLIGLLMQGLMVALLTTILAPLLCTSHPNGLSTCVAYPGIICWTSDHTEMLVLAVCAVLFPLGYGTSLAVVTWRFQRAAAQGDLAFLRRWSFIFFRVKPHATWFPFITQMRSWLIVFSIVPSAAIVQSSCMTLLMTIWLALVVWATPYISTLANVMEALQAGALLQLLALAPAFLSDGHGEQVAAQAGTVFFIVSVVSLPLALLAAARHIWMSRKKAFSYFLSHHKDGAGAFARLLKLELSSSSKVSGEVFLDSDNLTDLDFLLDVVAFQIEKLVILVTDKIFFRPWCLAEVAVAEQQDVDMISVYIADCDKPTDDFIESLPKQLLDIAELGRFGLGWPHLQQGLRSLQRMDANISFGDFVTAEAVKDLASRLLRRRSDELSIGTASHDLAKYTSPISNSSTSKESFFVLADSTDMEAVASALILARLLPVNGGFTVMPTMLLGGQELPALPHVTCLVLCSSGVLDQKNVLISLKVAMRTSASTLPVFLNNDFRVPSGKDVEAHALAFGEKADDIKEALKQMFRTIAVRFSPKESLTLMKLQVSNIGLRLRVVEADSAVRKNLAPDVRKGSGLVERKPSGLTSNPLDPESSTKEVCPPPDDPISSLECFASSRYSFLGHVVQIKEPNLVTMEHL